ncbi:DUF1523 family protein [Litoreibacter janthinus]|uniref:DUF1523 domain-containing protein n=1 Tax=Litoreibacter janthinus TaxID=670154 RepID=A0A1I6HX58_9RHOB|nr:DUF1523 family protein [Litoreibacter janthinus]SFR58800.1 Protein of unknown function [Litoreibacter janthinus]
MRWVKYTIVLLFWVLVAAFLHYTLPQRDIVRIVETEVRRVDFGENSIFWASADSGQDTTGANRDVRFINAVLYDSGKADKSGRVMVYRNEDTGWGWPPYFKLDSSNLQTEAADLASTKADPQWVVITHYGWRNEFLSIFPNAAAVRATDDPEKTLIPYFNILILIILAGICLGFFRLSQWFKRSKIDPITESVGETWDAVDDYADEKRSGFRSWLDTWKGKPRK